MVEPVELLGGLGLAGEVRRFRRAELQAGGEFVGADAGFEFGIGSPGLRMGAVERSEEIAGRLLRITAEVGELLGWEEVLERRLRRVAVQGRALVDRGQEAGAPVDDPAWRQAARIGQHDERG